MTSWQNGSKGNKKRVLQELIPHRWVAYKIRLLLTADRCGALAPFGWISIHFDQLATCLYLSVAENVDTSISYGRLGKDHTRPTDRRRREEDIFFVSCLKKENRERKRKAIGEDSPSPRLAPLFKTPKGGPRTRENLPNEMEGWKGNSQHAQSDTR